MIHQRAAAADKPALAQLWQQAFGDDEAYTDFVFDRFAGLENTWIARDADEVVASVCAVPVRLRELRGIYLYGVNTKKELRGNGIMDALLRFVHEEARSAGCVFATLVPAGEDLFRYYGKFGYEPLFEQRVLTCPIRANLWAQAQFDTITASRLTQMRTTYLPEGFVCFTGGAHAAMVQNLYTGGATTVETDSGYGVFFKMQEVLVFQELMARDTAAAMRILQASREQTGAERAVVKLPSWSDLFLGEGKSSPYGMLCWLSGEQTLYNPYMGLMCD
ncbi:MAG: GNAT family N-acetyltransferase [Pygmaiobacter sp.]